MPINVKIRIRSRVTTRLSDSLTRSSEIDPLMIYFHIAYQKLKIQGLETLIKS